MSQEQIYADASQPATLLDGDRTEHCCTLGESVIAKENLPADRKRAAKIRCGSKAFGGHYGTARASMRKFASGRGPGVA